MRLFASPRPIRITGERQSPRPTLRPEKVSPNTDTSVPLGAVTDAPRSAHVAPQRPVRRGPVRSARLPVSTWTPRPRHRLGAQKHRFKPPGSQYSGYRSTGIGSGASKASVNGVVVIAGCSPQTALWITERVPLRVF